jgi:hypothetical protein
VLLLPLPLPFRCWSEVLYSANAVTAKLKSDTRIMSLVTFISMLVPDSATVWLFTGTQLEEVGFHQ